MSRYIESLRDMLEEATQGLITFSQDGAVVTNDFLNGVTTIVMANADTVKNQYESTGITISDTLKDPWDKAAQAIQGFNNDADKLALMNAWTKQGGVFDNFKNTATGQLTSPWNSGKKALESFSASVGTEMSKVVNSVKSNVDTAKGYLDGLASSYANIQSTTLTVPSSGGSGGEPAGKITNPSGPSVIAIQEILKEGFGLSLAVDGKYGPETTAAVKKAQEMANDLLNKSFPEDGKYTWKTMELFIAYFTRLINSSGNTGRPGDIQIYQNAFKKIPKYPLHAKGTLGTTRDEWAITDESWIGEEITLAAGKSGQLQYLKKGSAVMPADISANLVEWGKLNPSMLNIANPASGFNMISNAVNKPEFNLSFDSLVHVDNCSQETVKDLEKMVDTKINQFSKQLNYSLKRFK